MTALTAYAFAALHRHDPVLARHLKPASYLAPAEPWDFIVEAKLRATHRLLVARADWRHFQCIQLDLWSGALERSGPKQLGAPPERPTLRRAACLDVAGNVWRWTDALADT